MIRRRITDVERKIMKDIAYNLKRLLKRQRLTQKDLSEMTGLSTSAVSDYVNEKTLMAPSILQTVAKALGVKSSEINPALLSIDGSVTESDMVKLPIVGQISCGNGVIAFEDVEGYEPTPKQWLNGGEYFYLRAKGDSMIGARINDGDLVLIRKQPEVENGQIAAVLLENDEAVLKRFFKTGDQVVLRSENLEYAPIFSPPAKVKVIGRAIRVVAML